MHRPDTDKEVRDNSFFPRQKQSTAEKQKHCLLIWYDYSEGETAFRVDSLNAVITLRLVESTHKAVTYLISQPMMNTRLK